MQGKKGVRSAPTSPFRNSHAVYALTRDKYIYIYIYIPDTECQCNKVYVRSNIFMHLRFRVDQLLKNNLLFTVIQVITSGITYSSEKLDIIVCRLMPAACFSRFRRFAKFYFCLNRNKFFFKRIFILKALKESTLHFSNNYLHLSSTRCGNLE